MTAATERTGQCLCGAVAIRATVDTSLLACHCGQCQRWTGGGPLVSARVRGFESLREGETIAYHASHWGERVVCASCGSTLWWKMQGKPVSSVAVGMLDDQSGLTVTEEIFVDYRPGWLPPWAGATQSTEADQVAKLDAYLAKETP